MKLPAIPISRWALNSQGDVYRLDGYVGIGTDSPGGLLGLRDGFTYIDVDTGTGEILFSDAINGIKRLSQLGGGIPNLLLEVQDAVITILKDIDGYASDITVSEHYNQLSQAVHDITSGLDGYALAPSVGSGADGYVAFFTGSNSIAGDNDLFWDRENNRLGIGSSTPSTKLYVVGDGYFSNGDISIDNGSVYITGVGERALSIRREDLVSAGRTFAQFQAGRIVEGPPVSGFSPKFRFVYTDNLIFPTERTVFEFEETGTGAFVRAAGSSGSYVEGARETESNPRWRIQDDGDIPRIEFRDPDVDEALAAVAFARWSSGFPRVYAPRTDANLQIDCAGLLNGQGTLSFSSNSTFDGYLSVGTIINNATLHVAGDALFDGYVSPITDNQWGLGTATNRWRDIFLGPGSLHIISNASENNGGITRDWTIGADGNGGVAIKTGAATKLAFGVAADTWNITGNISARAPSGATNSEQFGELAVASGTDSTALGRGATANNTNTTAIGSSAQATTSGSTAVGQNAQAVNSADSTVIGVSSLANGGDGVAVGRSAQATANRAVAIGRNAVSSQSEATATGYAATAQQVQAAAFGAFSNANQIGATALGALAAATGTSAIAVGTSSVASVTNAISVGSSTAAATNTIVIGQSITTTSAATSATIVGKPTGSVTGADVTALGHNTNVGAGAARVTVIGHNAIAQNDDTTSVGRGAQVTGLQSSAFGSGSVATGSSAVALGFGAQATGTSNTAIGHNSTTGSAGSNTAMGKGAQAGGSANTDSVAIGETALATALRAIAVGADASAASTNSIAIGQGSSAGPLGTNPNCVAIGFGTQANGINGATAIGSTATASATQSTALGKDTVANQTNATAVGYSADATGSDSTALGSQSTASSSGTTAFGSSATASGSNSTAIGATTNATNTSTVCIGASSRAAGSASLAIGQNAQAQTGADNTILIGQGIQTVNPSAVAIGSSIGTNIGSNSIAIGTSSNANALTSIAIGTGATANTAHSVAIGASSAATGSNGSTALGRDAQATGADSTSVGHGPIVQATNAVVVSSAAMTVTSAGSASTIVGKTTSSVSAANVTGVGHNIDIGIGVADTTAIGASAIASIANSTAVGSNASAAGANGTTAIGRSASAGGTDSTAIGRNTVASASTTTAVGFSADATQVTASAFGANSQATGAGATALGNNAQATGTDSTAVGLSAIANQSLATAVGDGTTASGLSSTSLGQGASASSSNTTASGQGASASVGGATAYGQAASASGTDAIAIGRATLASGSGSISIGQGATNIFSNSFSIGQNAVTSGNNQGVFATSVTPIDLVNFGSFGLGTPTIAQNFKLEVAGDIGPNVDDAYSLGSASFRWKDGYFGPGTLHFMQNASENDTGVERQWDFKIDSSGNLAINQALDNTMRLATQGGISTMSTAFTVSGSFTAPSFQTSASSCILNNLTFINGPFAFSSSEQSPIFNLNVTFDQFGLFGGSNSGNQFVLGMAAFYQSDYNHPHQGDPTMFIHSRTDPGVNSSQWLGLYHDTTRAYIETGLGSITLAPYDGYVIPVADDAYSLGSPTQRWGELWLGPGSLHIKQNAIENEIGIERDWALAIDSPGSLAIKQGDDSRFVVSDIGRVFAGALDNDPGPFPQPIYSFNQKPDTGMGWVLSGTNRILSLVNNGVSYFQITTSTIGATPSISLGAGNGVNVNFGNSNAIGFDTSGQLSWTGQSLRAWLVQQQDGVGDVRLIGSADAVGEYAARIGTKYTAAQNGNLATILQVGLDMDGTSPVPSAEFYGDGSVSFINTTDGNSITLKHTGLDGYVQTTFGNLVLSPANARVVPGGDAYGIGDFDNRWSDGYFKDTNTYGLVTGIISIESIDSPYLARQDDYTIICDASGGVIAVVLPAAGGANKGRIYNIKKVDATNNVDIQASGLETIDGASSITLNVQYANRQIQSDGNNWWIL